MTVFVHGEAGYQDALETTEKTFGKQNAPAESLTLEDLEGMDGVTKFDYELTKVQAGVDVVTFLAETKIFPSKGEARKMVQGGGVSINRKKLKMPNLTVDSIIIAARTVCAGAKRTRRHFYLVKAV